MRERMLGSVLALLAGVILDQLFADPETRWHPICIIGRLISALEDRLRRTFPEGREQERKAGCILTVTVTGICFTVPALVLFLCYRRDLWLGVLAESLICYFMLSEKTLERESGRVAVKLKEEGLEAAREAVGRIVGRDTGVLDGQGVIRAAIESVAENFSDGVFAPMFYMVLGGGALCTAYKGINTMDSMVGYRNERYLNFGRCAAKTDDAANFVPARLSGLLIAAAAPLCGLDGKRAIEIFLRDRKKHDSPNSAHTEAAAAGALGLRLGGPSSYFGTIHEKPYIGDALRDAGTEDILLMNRLMRTASLLGLIILLAVKGALIALM